ncbi:hypothetical protein GXP67_26045 [Rhodocytophaga rosea]|uniref:Galactose oxidase n=1 Tax=Rhodocytophaga rosea TaxID=2704465 RepID=A0A6C0GP90_9BACT|nr:hypothetical protein [Rhodocytophaga rosea]QHT69861.1 hypothetical protein GXP67_26045 [Rhodocytophaga rosea]
MKNFYIQYLAKIFAVATLLGCLISCTQEVATPTDKSGEVTAFWQKAAMPNQPRNEGIVGLLADGRVILTGGYLSNGSSSSSLSTEVYDPVTDTWTIVSDKSPEGSPSGFFRLKNGHMILFNRSSAIVNVFDPVKNHFYSIGQHGGLIGDWLTVSGACELSNGKVIIVGRSSLTVWDQQQSFKTFSLNSGTSSVRFGTVHQLPNSNQFMILGNSYYQGKAIIYELNSSGQNEPIQLGNPFNIAGINTQSAATGNGKLLLMGGSLGTTVNNGAIPPTLFNPANNSLTKVMNTEGGFTAFSMGMQTVIGTDEVGNIWFTDERLQRYKFDLASEKVVLMGNPFDSTKVVPSPFTETYISSIILKDGRTLAFDKDQAWISKQP